MVYSSADSPKRAAAWCSSSTKLPGLETRFHFEDYVLAHTRRRALTDSVEVVRFFVCRNCGDPVPDSYVKRLADRGMTTFDCPCGGTVSLAPRSSPWTPRWTTRSRCERTPGIYAWMRGIHIGPMQVEEGDVFGGTVNFTSRVVAAVAGAAILLSDRAREDIEHLGAKHHRHLRFQRHDAIALRGFRDTFTLWSAEESQ